MDQIVHLLTGNVSWVNNCAYMGLMRCHIGSCVLVIFTCIIREKC